MMTKKQLMLSTFLLALMLLAFIFVVLPALAFAHVQSVSPSSAPFYACENPTSAVIDPATITQNPASLACATPNVATGWDGTGPQGPAGSSFVFGQTPCAEIGLSGPAQQENLLFCQGIEPDGGFVYKVAIAAASAKVIVGTPIAQFHTRDWSGVPITYEEFTSGLHMEWHDDNVVRVYNTLNQRVF